MEKEFYIKNMVCRSCVKVIKDAFQKQGLSVVTMEIGKVVISTENIPETKKQLIKILRNNDFDLVETPEDKLVEQVKIHLIKLVDSFPVCPDLTLSDYLRGKLHQDYSTMSKIFSFSQQVTIEKYYIKLKVEKVKEMIHSQEYNFTEMSQLLGYSNLGHLSAQFKAETGMSLTKYKTLGPHFRNSLNRII